MGVDSCTSSPTGSWAPLNSTHLTQTCPYPVTASLSSPEGKNGKCESLQVASEHMPKVNQIMQDWKNLHTGAPPGFPTFLCILALSHQPPMEKAVEMAHLVSWFPKWGEPGKRVSRNGKRKGKNLNISPAFMCAD